MNDDRREKQTKTRQDTKLIGKEKKRERDRTHLLWCSLPVCIVFISYFSLPRTPHTLSLLSDRYLHLCTPFAHSSHLSNPVLPVLFPSDYNSSSSKKTAADRCKLKLLSTLLSILAPSSPQLIDVFTLDDYVTTSTTSPLKSSSSAQQ